MNYSALLTEIQKPEYADLSDAQVAEAINALQVQETTAERVSYTDLLARLTPDEFDSAYGLFSSAMSRPCVIQSNKALESGGLNFAHENVQAMLDSVFADNIALRDKLKGLGFRTRRWIDVNGCSRYGEVFPWMITKLRTENGSS